MTIIVDNADIARNENIRTYDNLAVDGNLNQVTERGSIVDDKFRIDRGAEAEYTDLSKQLDVVPNPNPSMSLSTGEQCDNEVPADTLAPGAKQGTAVKRI